MPKLRRSLLSALNYLAMVLGQFLATGVVLNLLTARAAKYQRVYRRIQRAGDCTTPGTSRLLTEFRVRIATDVLALLDEQIAAVVSCSMLAMNRRDLVL